MRSVVAVAVAVLLLASERAHAWDDDYEQELCENARDEASSAASDLEYAARALMNCASYDDHDDDCTAEFWRVRSAHDEYESAAGDVDSYCSDY